MMIQKITILFSMLFFVGNSFGMKNVGKFLGFAGFGGVCMSTGFVAGQNSVLKTRESSVETLPQDYNAQDSNANVSYFGSTTKGRVLTLFPDGSMIAEKSKDPVVPGANFGIDGDYSAQVAVQAVVSFGLKDGVPVARVAAPDGSPDIPVGISVNVLSAMRAGYNFATRQSMPRS